MYSFLKAHCFCVISFDVDWLTESCIVNYAMVPRSRPFWHQSIIRRQAFRPTAQRFSLSYSLLSFCPPQTGLRMDSGMSLQWRLRRLKNIISMPWQFQQHANRRYTCSLRQPNWGAESFAHVNVLTITCSLLSHRISVVWLARKVLSNGRWGLWTNSDCGVTVEVNTLTSFLKDVSSIELFSRFAIPAG